MARLPEGGCPKYSPVCVASKRHRVATRSPSATWVSIITVKSEKARWFSRDNGLPGIEIDGFHPARRDRFLMVEVTG